MIPRVIGRTQFTASSSLGLNRCSTPAQFTTITAAFAFVQFVGGSYRSMQSAVNRWNRRGVVTLGIARQGGMVKKTSDVGGVACKSGISGIDK